jgi:PLP dependent protein
MYPQILEEARCAKATLIAVSKTKPIEDLKTLYHQGQKHFGENKVQELCDKYESLPKDIHWHLIGHLQSNKVKYIVPFVHLIHSVDSMKLLNEIQKEAAKIYRRVDVLLQLHIATENTKFGLSYTEADEMLQIVNASPDLYSYTNIVGIMGMASFTENASQVTEEFATLKNYFQLLKDNYYPFDSKFKEISMGMSGDYKLALQNGSTMIRVGSLIFGSR